MEHAITSFRQLYYACKEQNKTIYDAALDYEVSKGEHSEYQVRMQAAKSLNAMKEAIKIGLKSTEPSPSGMAGMIVTSFKKDLQKKMQSLEKPHKK